MPAPVPLINGVNWAWGNVTLILFNQPVIGITKISYKSKQEITNNYGIGVFPISRGFGRVEFEASIEIYTEEWKRIIAAANALGIPNPMAFAPFDITVVFGSTSSAPSRDVLKKCSFLEDPLEANEGDTKLMVTIPILPGQIQRGS